MTREEAVEVLKERYLTCVGIGLDNHANRVNEAIDMAIEALQAEAEQVTSKLKKPCDSLLTEDSEDSKEQKSKLDHDREWIIGCIKHDGFIKTDRFDKANQIILDALEPQTDTDLISRADAVKAIESRQTEQWIDADVDYNNGLESALAEIKSLPSAEADWIPVKWHEITDEEREREGYPKDWVVHIDCEMPCDEQEILVQTKKGYIRWDVCYEDGEFSLDSGWDWIEDIVAWMPLPKPYREDGEA